MVASALQSIEAARECGLGEDRIVVSCKVSSPRSLIAIYRDLAANTRQPLHLGLTEAGLGAAVWCGRPPPWLFFSPTASATRSGSPSPRLRGAADRRGRGCPRAPAGPRSAFLQTAVVVLPRMRANHERRVSGTGPKDRRPRHTAHERRLARTYPGVEDLTIAVMGCIVNGPGESRHADIGISLPGTGEEPRCPVFVDGQQVAILDGTIRRDRRSLRALRRLCRNQAFKEAQNEPDDDDDPTPSCGVACLRRRGQRADPRPRSRPRWVCHRTATGSAARWTPSGLWSTPPRPRKWWRQPSLSRPTPSPVRTGRSECSRRWLRRWRLPARRPPLRRRRLCSPHRTDHRPESDPDRGLSRRPPVGPPRPAGLRLLCRLARAVGRPPGGPAARPDHRRLPVDAYVVDNAMQCREHSLEALLPFLQHKQPQRTIVPILVPYMGWERIEELSDELAAAVVRVMRANDWKLGRDLAIVVSSDAVHYGPDFDHAPFGTDITAYERAVARDTRLATRYLEGPLDRGQAPRAVWTPSSSPTT